jgi:hypothetical protein
MKISKVLSLPFQPAFLGIYGKEKYPIVNDHFTNLFCMKGVLHFSGKQAVAFRRPDVQSLPFQLAFLGSYGKKKYPIVNDHFTNLFCMKGVLHFSGK